MRIIPAIDIINGKCVRLSQGDYNRQQEYDKDPLDMALEFQDQGIGYLHLVDLDGARSRHVVNWKVLEKIASRTKLKIDFGGGVKSTHDLDVVFECGAAQATAGSIAVQQPDTVFEWMEKYGPGKIILGADAKDRMIAVNGWEEETAVEIMDFIDKYVSHGLQYCVCTDIALDGMLQGPSLALYNEIHDRFPGLNLIASGGVSKLQDIENLSSCGVEGVIIGKALYENRISLKELKNWL